MSVRVVVVVEESEKLYLVDNVSTWGLFLRVPLGMFYEVVIRTVILCEFNGPMISLVTPPFTNK